MKIVSVVLMGPFAEPYGSGEYRLINAGLM